MKIILGLLTLFIAAVTVILGDALAVEEQPASAVGVLRGGCCSNYCLLCTLLECSVHV